MKLTSTNKAEEGWINIKEARIVEMTLLGSGGPLAIGGKRLGQLGTGSAPAMIFFHAGPRASNASPFGCNGWVRGAVETQIALLMVQEVARGRCKAVDISKF